MNKRSTRFDLQRLLTAKSPGAQALWGLSLLLLLLGVASCLSSRPLILIYPTANPVLETQRHGGLFLTTAQIGALPTDDIAALQTAQLKALSSAIIGALNQSYSFSGISGTFGALGQASLQGSTFADAADAGDMTNNQSGGSVTAGSFGLVTPTAE